ncbi:MAG: hypothetical protein Q9159_000869 [Coniocarpon cinnabarinum]
MAAGMFGSSNPLMSGASGQARLGDQLEEVVTENVGFVPLNGDSRPLRILPNPWPNDALPPPTASLFSIASRNGILAAADPSKLVIAKTKDVRSDLARKDGSEEKVKTLSRSMTIDLPARVSQIAFSSDEKYLVISAESGGGLLVYETDSIKQNNPAHAFQIYTDNIGVRALIPNPAEDQGHLFAVVLTDGKLMIANMKEQGWLKNGQGSPLLKDTGVSCCSWSAKGKQLVAGLQDATALQLKPDGSIQATIPKPPATNDPRFDNCYAASLLWLDNDRFFIIYNSHADAMDLRTFVITRQENAFSFRKLANEPLAPFGQLRQPPHYFLSRLRSYEPHLKDAIFASTTCGPDVGLVANSTTPLSREAPGTANTYAPVALSEDSRRAQLSGSVTDDMAMEDPSAIGMAFDFSPEELVKRPIPQQADALEQAPQPVPAIMVLNHEGVLSAWWFIYNDGIIQSKIYGAMNVASRAPTQQTSSATSTPAQPTFGNQSALSTFKTPSATTNQPFGTGASPWSSQQKGPAFGQSGFGAPSFGTPAQAAFGTPAAPSQPSFGSASGLGNSNKAFGGASTNSASPFGKVMSQGVDANKSSRFGAFSANKDSAAGSPFAKFNTGAEKTSLFGKPSGDSASFGTSTFGQQQNLQTGWGFGQPEKKDDKPPGFNQEPSSGSTMTIGSSFTDFGKPSGLGPDASPWATPALSTKTTMMQPSDNKAQDEDADMDMDKKADNIFGSGMSGLGLGESKAEPSKPVGKPAEEPKIKTEPVDDAPLPPDWTTKPSESDSAKGANEQAPSTPEPAPLPPSPKVDNNEQRPDQLKTPEKLAQDEGHNTSTTPQTVDPTPAKDKADEQSEQTEHSPAGSEPEIVEAEKSIPPSPTHSITTEADPTINLDKAGTWPRQKSPVQPTPNKSTIFGGESSTPTGSFSFGKTPTTEMGKPPILFKPPGPESPRSPSPIRQQLPGNRRIASPTRRGTPSPTRLAAPSPDRAVSSPAPTFAPTPRKPTSGLANQITPARSSPAPSSTPSVPPPRPASPSPSVDFAPAQDAEDRIQEDLAAPVRASKRLKSFIAHTDYVDTVSGTSTASQIERLYRDGNSMVDTLGLNAHTLAEFVRGQEELLKTDGERDGVDLEPERQDSWTLVEVDDLALLQRDLDRKLQVNRLQNVRATLEHLHDIEQHMTSIRNKRVEVARTVQEIRSVIDGETGPQSGRPRPKLNTEQLAGIRKLREGYATVQTRLAEAEDALSLFRAKIVAREAQNANAGAQGAGEVPTVEAVINTIAKMTRMAEMKRGDVDLLEARLKKLRRDSQAGSPDLSKSLSRMSLGASARRSVRISEAPQSPAKSDKQTPKQSFKTSRFSMPDSDDENDDDGVVVKKENNVADDELARSTKALTIQNDSSLAERKTLSGVSGTEFEDMVEREANRRRVLNVFRREVVKRGPRMKDLTKV